jgi:hypothetical protein
MHHVKLALAGLAASLLAGCVVHHGGENWASCEGTHRLQVVDLDMTPDPVTEGQRIGQFRIYLRADSTGECATQLHVRDGDEIVASERVYRLRPGTNEIRIEPDNRYHFRRKEHCFQVVANIERSNRPVDGKKRFCARNIGGGRWSLAN